MKNQVAKLNMKDPATTARNAGLNKESEEAFSEVTKAANSYIQNKGVSDAEELSKQGNDVLEKSERFVDVYDKQLESQQKD